jgi:hypothetical protein
LVERTAMDLAAEVLGNVEVRVGDAEHSKRRTARSTPVDGRFGFEPYAKTRHTKLDELNPLTTRSITRAGHSSKAPASARSSHPTTRDTGRTVPSGTRAEARDQLEQTVPGAGGWRSTR